MDFELHYSAEQEEFRKEVQSWLDANIPKELKVPLDAKDQSEEHHQWAVEFQRKMGAKGWRAPIWPKEYGGGGLSVAHAIVIAEELAKWDAPTNPDLGLTLCAPAIMKWASGEFKREYLPKIFRGDITIWQFFTEPEAGSDLASLKTRAVRDGDDYVINGQKMFVGGWFWADYGYTLAVTNPEAPRHQNISAFLVPLNSEGITRQRLNLVANGNNMIFFDNVRVPASQRIGPEGEGWWVAATTLDVEHGGAGSVAQRQPLIEKVINYAKQTRRNGRRLSEDPLVRQTLVELYIQTHVGRLFQLRNYWIRNVATDGKFTYEGPQNSLHGKMEMHKMATGILRALGPQALIKDPEFALLQGEVEQHQRGSLFTHPGGTPEVQKVIMARVLGLSRGRG